MFTTPDAKGCSRKLKIEGKNLYENKHALPGNQDKETSTHWAFATIASPPQKKKKKEETFTVQNTWCVAGHLLISDVRRLSDCHEACCKAYKPTIPAADSIKKSSTD